MSYGEAPSGNPVYAQFAAEIEGVFNFKLYPKLWNSADLGDYYRGREWNVYEFSDEVPDIPNTSGIYMFVVGPHCGGLKDHSYIFYVGQTKTLKTRYRAYQKERLGQNPDKDRKPVVRFLNYFTGYLYFYYTLVPEDELDRAEALLKDNLTPYANTQIDLESAATIQGTLKL